MNSAPPIIDDTLDETRLLAAIAEQKSVVARLVSLGRSAVEANIALYKLTDAHFRIRSDAKAKTAQHVAMKPARLPTGQSRVTRPYASRRHVKQWGRDPRF
jgi:hypothetical protein